MPVLKFIPTTQLSLKEIQNTLPGFIAPQMYYTLLENSDLLNLLEAKIVQNECEFTNSFEYENKDKICEIIT